MSTEKPQLAQDTSKMEYRYLGNTGLVYQFFPMVTGVSMMMTKEPLIVSNYL